MLESLLQPVTDDQPTGIDLEYDPDFIALVEAAKGTPERVMGTSLVPAQEPDWRQVLESGTTLLARSKDLRVAVLVTRALLGLNGLPGLQDGLELIHNLLLQFWDGLHPPLDESDDNDPTARVNVLLELTDRDTLLAQLRTTPMIRSRAFGLISMREIEIAEGRAQATPGAQMLDSASISAAFQDCELEDLAAAAAAAQAALAALDAVDKDLAERISSTQLPSLEPLAEFLKQIETLLQGHLRTRQPPEAGVAPAAAPGAMAPEKAEGQVRAALDRGQIVSREDVVQTLERICDYYHLHEPSSPVPLLLKRAQRLVHGSFVDIIRDLAPEGLSQVVTVCGIENES